MSGEQRLEHLGSQPGQLEPVAVPELVRRHDLRFRDRRGERRLAGTAAPADADEGEGAPWGNPRDAVEDGLHVHVVTVEQASD